MVHNGIEYADMQLIAESLRPAATRCSDWTTPRSPSVFEAWNSGELERYLIEITAEVLAKTDEATGKPLVDVILDAAEQKGTGRWTAQNALELGVPLTGITEAVFARTLSALKPERVAAETAPGSERRPTLRQRGYRRPQRRAVRVEDCRLRAGFRADGGRGARVRMGSQPRRDGDDLARRLHHPRRFLDRIKEAYDDESRLREPHARRLLRQRAGTGARSVAPCVAGVPKAASRRLRSPRRWPTTTATVARAGRPA